MAVVTIQELLAQRELIQEKKNQLYEFETSVGTIVVKQPTASMVAEIQNMRNAVEGNALLIYNCVVQPDLNNAELQKVYKAFEPTDVIKAIFKPGEIVRITDALLDIAGYSGQIERKLHEEISK